MHLKDSSTKDLSEKRKFKLLKIELKEFDGDAEDYLIFWSQFRKIHEDASIPNEDKFQYLLQGVVPKSKAAGVVESFPATADNYPKAISQLWERSIGANLCSKRSVVHGHENRGYRTLKSRSTGFK
ncbi:hypothetical protein AVEN_5640-1 [Araneus ventricosus]|uniref:Uncharacterized protein n=1 Tax=Araneus ventricosus TaxID=182803 RepID=A0A4Y2QDG5_ARAVE|nr:hypothetical protein AVEN_2646-1 [Araneus ventricosus]GBN60730.1 hypothetical protein AVEN_5640-1 [Araneus ventricosus]